MDWKIAALYRFVSLGDLDALRAELRDLCRQHGLCGTLLLAGEGVNGTIAGPEAGLDAAIDALDRRLGIRAGEVKFSSSREKPFARMKVRIRPEIVTLRAPEADPSRRAGTYVAPADWNALIRDPDVLVVDTRNRYETRVGTFRGALDPDTQSFTEFKRFVAERLGAGRQQKIAMFCTGGIRCEKASAYLLEQGFGNVFHLKGGILGYLEAVPEAESLWEGDCYVFDGRVAVGHGLRATDWELCFGCGHPLTPEERSDAVFEAGVSCRHCIDRLTPAKADALRMRHRQMTGEKGRDREPEGSSFDRREAARRQRVFSIPPSTK